MEGNFGFYGLLMGYMVGLMIVLVVDGHTIKVILYKLRNFTEKVSLLTTQ